MRTLAIAALIAAVAAPAFAQPPMPTPEERAAAFAKADVNKDGKLSKDEFKTTLPEQAQQFADQVFDRRDANKDGFIDATENSAPMGRRGG
jgi:Ca2+-binding EF-hand superfamily protein